MTPGSAATKAWKATPSGIASTARYETSDKGRQTRRRAKAAWKARNLARARDHNRILQRVRYYVATGRIVKKPCRCGRTDVQAHHFLGYAPEHELDVVWLCPPCHAEAHGRRRAAA